MTHTCYNTAIKDIVGILTSNHPWECKRHFQTQNFVTELFKNNHSQAQIVTTELFQENGTKIRHSPVSRIKLWVNKREYTLTTHEVKGITNFRLQCGTKLSPYLSYRIIKFLEEKTPKHTHNPQNSGVQASKALYNLFYDGYRPDFDSLFNSEGYRVVYDGKNDFNLIRYFEGGYIEVGNRLKIYIHNAYWDTVRKQLRFPLFTETKKDDLTVLTILGKDTNPLSYYKEIENLKTTKTIFVNEYPLNYIPLMENRSNYYISTLRQASFIGLGGMLNNYEHNFQDIYEFKEFASKFNEFRGDFSTRVHIDSNFYIDTQFSYINGSFHLISKYKNHILNVMNDHPEDDLIQMILKIKLGFFNL